MQRILGLIDWFRDYVANLSIDLANIYGKTHKSLTFTWTNEDASLIQQVLTKIKEQTLLNYPDYNAPFQLFTDAYEVGIGAILKQKDKLIGFYSYKLNPSESNYSIMQKELFAVIKSLLHFKPIIFTSHIEIFTTNINILTTLHADSRRIARWKLLLCEYDIKLIHIPGKQNVGADSLSRLYQLDTNPKHP